MVTDIWEAKFTEIEIFGKYALFSSERIKREAVPSSLYVYDIRGNDDDPGVPETIENDRVFVNYVGTVLTSDPLPGFDDTHFYLNVNDQINFIGSEEITIAEFMNKL